MISEIGGSVCNTVFNHSVCSQNYGNALGWVVLTGTAVLGLVSIVALKRLSLGWNSGTKPLAGRRIDQFIDNFQGYCGIKAEDIGICDGQWRATSWSWNWKEVDKSLPVINADQFLNLDLSLLRKFNLDPLPPISFTFKGAVRFVIKLIDEAQKGYQSHLQGAAGVYLIGQTTKYGRPGIEGQFLNALRYIPTQNRHIIPSPPTNKWPLPSVNEDFNEDWLGVILRMLVDEGVITTYGQRCGIWVKLPLAT